MAAAEAAQQTLSLRPAPGVGRGASRLLARTPSLRASGELLDALHHARHGALLSVASV
jgi:hypothetical protein